MSRTGGEWAEHRTASRLSGGTGKAGADAEPGGQTAEAAGLCHGDHGAYAKQVLIRAGAASALAEPVFRDREKVRVRRMQERYASVAVIARKEEEAALLDGSLGAAGLAPALITADQTWYRGGLSVIPSYLTKGLEFDGEITPLLSEVPAELYTS